MATITPTVTYNPNGQRQCVLVRWAGLANGDVGAPVNLPMYADGSVQIESNGSGFGGGTLTMQMCNETTPTNWQAMTDPQGNDIAKTAGDMEQLQEIAQWIRPSLGGGAAGGVDVTCLLRRNP